MTFEEICEYFGNINCAAKAIGIKRQSAYKWRTMGFIPYDKQLRFEDKSKGKLKANVNSQIESLKTKNTTFFPLYRFYSDKLGMCAVKSLIFKPGYPVRITYNRPNKSTTFTSFNTENLMQGANVKDKNGVYLFEKDIILLGKHEYTCETLSFIYSLKDQKDEFIIIGNTFLGE